MMSLQLCRPAKFARTPSPPQVPPSRHSEESSDDYDDELFVNTNRPCVESDDTDSESDSNNES